MPQKKKPKTTSKSLAPNTHFPPFNNLTNNLSLQYQHSATQLFTDSLTETAKHDTDPLNKIRYPAVYMDPSNETIMRYPVSIYSFIAILYIKVDKLKFFL